MTVDGKIKWDDTEDIGDARSIGGKHNAGAVRTCDVFFDVQIEADWGSRGNRRGSGGDPGSEDTDEQRSDSDRDAQLPRDPASRFHGEWSGLRGTTRPVDLASRDVVSELLQVNRRIVGMLIASIRFLRQALAQDAL